MGDEVFIKKHGKKVIFCLAAIVATTILIIIFAPIIKHASEPTYISVNVAPVNATVLINGEEYSKGTSEIRPGKYTATISAEGFISKNIDLEIKKHETTNIINYLLHEQEGLNYYERDASDLAALRLNDAQEVQDFLSTYDYKVRIKDELPMNATFNKNEQHPELGNILVRVIISNGSDNANCHHAFCLLVNGSSDEDLIKNFLAKNGYEYADYEVIYE